MGTSIGYGTSQGANQRTEADFETAGVAAAGALKAKRVRIRPAAASHYGGDGLFDLALVRIAARDQAQRQAVGAEDELRVAAIGEARQGGFDVAYERLDILRMQVKFFDGDLAGRGRGRAPVRRSSRGKNAAPFFEAAARGGE